jgi:hypothetical protein
MYFIYFKKKRLNISEFSNQVVYLGEGIVGRQCTKKNLLKIVAIKNLNLKSKGLVKFQIFLVSLPIIVATFLVIIRNTNAEAALIPPLLGFIVTISNFALIYPVITEKRRISAEIYHDFDCSVLNLPWNHIKLDKPKSEDICGGIGKDLDWEDVQPCYPSIIDEVPLPVARIICQRKFLGGDGKVRGKFILSIKVLLVILFILSLVFAFINSLNVFQFLSNLLLPFLPASVFTVKLIQDNSNSIKRSTFLKNKIEFIWNKILEGKCDDELLGSLALRIQDELLEKRKTDPVILNYFYDKFRESLGSSPYSVERMVNDYLS